MASIGCGSIADARAEKRYASSIRAMSMATSSRLPSASSRAEKIKEGMQNSSPRAAEISNRPDLQ
jgi:hypothetical protein